MTLKVWGKGSKMGEGNVVMFTGTTALPIDPDRLLVAASGQLETVLILGYDRDGEFYFSSSCPEVPEISWLILQAQDALLNLSREG